MYNYNETLNLLIGNNDNANIKYVCPYLSNSLIKVSYKENRLILENLDKTFGIYLNNKILLTQNTFINIGDQINIYGLKIIFLKGQMLINCPNERLMITENTANISKCIIDVSSELKNLH